MMKNGEAAEEICRRLVVVTEMNASDKGVVVGESKLPDCSRKLKHREKPPLERCVFCEKEIGTSPTPSCVGIRSEVLYNRMLVVLNGKMNNAG